MLGAGCLADEGRESRRSWGARVGVAKRLCAVVAASYSPVRCSPPTDPVRRARGFVDTPCRHPVARNQHPAPAPASSPHRRLPANHPCPPQNTPSPTTSRPGCASSARSKFAVPGDYAAPSSPHRRERRGHRVPVTTSGAGYAADAYARLRGAGCTCLTYGWAPSACSTEWPARSGAGAVALSSAASFSQRSVERHEGVLFHHSPAR